jgi:Tol biopolymer transport system component
VYVSRARDTWQWLLSADRDGDRPQQIAQEADTPVVTPAGDVVFVAHVNGISRLWRTSPGGGQARPISDRHASTPAVSSDGRLAFVSLDDSRRQVLVVCDLPDCSSPKTFPPQAMGGSSGTWGRIRFTPDDRGIAYVTDGPHPNIWQITLDGSRPLKPLTSFQDDRMILDFAWSRGGRLAVVRARITSDIVLFKNLWRRP